MVLAILLFTVMDTLGKDLTSRYPVPQVVWARYFFQLALMTLLIPRVGILDLVRTGATGHPRVARPARSRSPRYA